MSQALPVFSDSGPDAASYGAADGYPIGTIANFRDQKFVVGTYSHLDQVLSAHNIDAPAIPSELARAPDELTVEYEYQGRRHTIADYLARNPTTGLLVLHDRTIQFEHYQYARRDTDRLNSHSMAKTILGMLIGIALQEGAIHSLDDKVVRYVPELGDTEVGQTPLRALMHMASGIDFHEVYDGKDDIRKLGRDLMGKDSKGAIDAVRQFNKRIADPDTEFHYAGLDSEVLGLVLTRATKHSLAELAESRIWQKIGAEASASWVVDQKGLEMAYCCFGATLRDWGRFGSLLAQNGAWDGAQIIPKQFLIDATTVQAPYLAPGQGGRRLGYGYQVWIMPGLQRQFALVGIYGQTMLIDPETRTVLVHTAVRPKARDREGQTELFALWNAVVAHQIVNRP
jgi:CubicO group peptidase (beta-lactamase class C family)